MQAPAAAVPVHYHHAWLIWVLFLCGEIIHILLQVDDIARKTKTRRRDVLYQIWPPVLFRAFACAMIFAIIWEHPDLIAQVAKMVGHPLGGDENEVLEIPMNNAIAGLYGLFLDSILGYIPIFKTQLPALTQAPTGGPNAPAS